MSFKVEKHKISDVLDWYNNIYENTGLYNWDITQKKIHFKGSYTKSDPEEAYAKLSEALYTLMGEDNIGNDYVLQLSSKSTSKTKTDSKLYCLTFDFKGELSQNQIGALPQYNSGLSRNDIKAIAEELQRLESENIEEEIEDLEPEKPNFLAGVYNSLNTLAATPEIQNAIATAIINAGAAVGSIFTRKNNVTQLAGICEDKNLDEVIQILFSKGVNISHLRKLADMPTDKIQMLIQML